MYPSVPYLKIVVAQRKRKLAFLGAGLIIAAAGFLHYVNPLEHLAWLHCPVNLTTGLYCPGCGSLRAAHAMLNGDFLTALHTNLLAAIALPVLAGIGINSIYQTVRGKPYTMRISPVVAWIVFWSIILFTILRNLPFESLQMLRP